MVSNDESTLLSSFPLVKSVYVRLLTSAGRQREHVFSSACVNKTKNFKKPVNYEILLCLYIRDINKINHIAG
jgi:hypothetical protein